MKTKLILIATALLLFFSPIANAQVLNQAELSAYVIGIINGDVPMTGNRTFGTSGNGVDVLIYGATASNSLLWDASADALLLATTSSSTSGGTSVRPLYMTHTMTGIGGVGGRAEFSMETNVALGGWSNALKGIVTYGAAGRTAGMGSAVLGELILSAGTVSGTYAPLESELVANSAVSTGTSTSFIYMNIGGSNGTGITTINTNGYLFEIGAGIADVTGGIFETESQADVDATHCLKIKIDGVDYYIPINTAKTF